MGRPGGYGKIAELLGKKTTGLTPMESASLAADAVEELLKSIQVPFHLRDYDISEKDIPKLAENGMKQARLFVTNPRDLNVEDVRTVYQRAY